jgi:hypothetical protein
MTATLSNATYNGWANYETWNVALWIQNDAGLYTIARRSYSYQDFVQQISWCRTQTPDGVSYTHPALDFDELNEMMEDL